MFYPIEICLFLILFYNYSLDACLFLGKDKGCSFRGKEYVKNLRGGEGGETENNVFELLNCILTKHNICLKNSIFNKNYKSK